MRPTYIRFSCVVLLWSVGEAGVGMTFMREVIGNIGIFDNDIYLINVY